MPENNSTADTAADTATEAGHTRNLAPAQAADLVGAWHGGSVIQVALSPNFDRDGVALAATLAGVFRSEDRGQTWRLSMTGMDEPTLTTVIFAKTSEGTPPAFAGTEGGRLYRSTDLGKSWRECESWAGLGVLTDLAAAPDFAAQPYLFAATISGAFRSLDGGDNWESCTFGLLDDEVLCMLCAPDFASSELVWCGTGAGGFFRSRNAAKAWREAGLGLPDSAVQALTVSPNFAQDKVLYAGMEDGGLYHTDDGGESWTIVGRATEPLPGAINSLALIPTPSGAAAPLRILAGTNWGVFWSEDGGDSWEAAANGDFIALHLVASKDEGSQETIIAGALSDGLHLSLDGGKHWQPCSNAPAAHAPPLVAAPEAGIRRPRRLFALDHDGVAAQSIDGGVNWAPLPGEVGQGQVADSAIFALAAGIATENTTDNTTDETYTLYLAGENQILRGHTQPGQADIFWEELSLPPTAEQAAPFVVVAPTPAPDPALLWGQYTGDMFLSEDSGASWDLLARPWGGDMTLSVTFSPNFATDRRLIAVAGHQNDGGHFQLSLWQSENAGHSWTELAALETETPSLLVGLPVDPASAAIFLATRYRLIRLLAPPDTSSDAGSEAESGANDLEVHQTIFDVKQRITALAVSPAYATDQTVFAGIDNVVHYSQDAGVTWQPLALVAEDTAVVSILPGASGQELTLVTLGGSVWRCPWPVAR